MLEIKVTAVLESEPNRPFYQITKNFTPSAYAGKSEKELILIVVESLCDKLKLEIAASV